MVRYVRTNDLTKLVQQIIDTYGVPRYKEVNPMLLTVVTFAIECRGPVFILFDDVRTFLVCPFGILRVHCRNLLLGPAWKG